MTKKQRIIYWSGSALVVLIAIFILIKVVITPPSTLTPDKITDQDWTQGNKDSKIILIEYSDFQCPACAYYYKIVESALKEFGNHIYFAYRHYPLSQHKNAKPAAYAAEAAGLQGKFWEMHDLLFESQKEWSNLVNPDEKFTQYAESLGLDKEKFITDYNSSEVKNAVEADGESGAKLKLPGTPSLFLNGKLINNPRDYESFRKLIRDTIDQNP